MVLLSPIFIDFNSIKMKYHCQVKIYIDFRFLMAIQSNSLKMNLDNFIHSIYLLFLLIYLK
jgi:hypothetical protein